MQMRPHPARPRGVRGHSALPRRRAALHTETGRRGGQLATGSSPPPAGRRGGRHNAPAWTTPTGALRAAPSVFPTQISSTHRVPFFSGRTFVPLRSTPIFRVSASLSKRALGDAFPTCSKPPAPRVSAGAPAGVSGPGAPRRRARPADNKD